MMSGRTSWHSLQQQFTQDHTCELVTIPHQLWLEDQEVWQPETRDFLCAATLHRNTTVFSLLASCFSHHRNSIGEAAWSSPQPPVSCSCTQLETDGGWDMREGEEQRRQVRFLCSTFSLWGQGSTVMHPNGVPVQKPPACKNRKELWCLATKTEVSTF